MKHIMELVVLAAFAVYIYMYFSINAMLATVVIAAGASAYTKSPRVAVGVCIAAVVFQLGSTFLQSNTAIMVPGNGVSLSNDPVSLPESIESFQPKDPISIHQRITLNKRSEPLEPKLENVTGVLESPEILDSLHLTDLSPSEMGGSHKTLPVGVMSAEPIRTPAEATLPPIDTIDSAPKSNPYLQNGPDSKGVMTALINKGTAMFSGNPSAEVPSVRSGMGRDYD
jgi:hypothetical protein